MEFLYEALALGFLTNGNGKFCCPQFAIKTDDGKAVWRCPDFVVLDFAERQIIIAEVTAAFDVKGFADKVVELYVEGRDKLRNQLVEVLKPLNIGTWAINVKLFVREDRKEELRKRLGGRIDLDERTIVTLEETLQRWKPNYGEQRAASRAGAN